MLRRKSSKQLSKKGSNGIADCRELASLTEQFRANCWGKLQVIAQPKFHLTRAAQLSTHTSVYAGDASTSAAEARGVRRRNLPISNVHTPTQG
jgi:hypothetical protein